MLTHEPLTPLLELDPDLARLLTPERAREAQAELGVRLSRIPRGLWEAQRLASAHPEHVGLLLVEGIVAREVLIADTVSTELLGPGDVVRPWRDRDDASLLAVEIRWTVLADVRLAVLDRRFAGRLARFPEVNAALLDRLTDRAQRMAVSQAISQLNGVDRRLLALFWHLAERWGRMTGQGVTVPLTLSHRVLAQLVGARRPTVSTALAELAERGDLTRRDDGTWLLAGDSIGLPTPEVARVIQHRRRLLRPEPRPSADQPAAFAAPLRWSAQRDRDELRLTLGRLREAVELESERLRDSRQLANELCRQAGDLRENRPRVNGGPATA
jgi:CRP/FNR family transcriptional regulator, cyclic AMP receptor protein